MGRYRVFSPEEAKERERIRKRRFQVENRMSKVTTEILLSLGSPPPSPKALADREWRESFLHTPNSFILGDPVTPRWQSNAA